VGAAQSHSLGQGCATYKAIIFVQQELETNTSTSSTSISQKLAGNSLIALGQRKNYRNDGPASDEIPLGAEH
jgi:hypothetical protein